MAIAHELQHMRQTDVGWEIGLKTLRLMFFWNPVFHVWKRAVDRLRELACDQQLLAHDRLMLSTIVNLERLQPLQGY